MMIGFNDILVSKIKKSALYIARCGNCKYFSANEVCVNNNVTPFDVIENGDRNYCALWSPEDAEK